MAFAQSSRFARRLDALLFDPADRDGYLDEVTAVLVLDHFALEYQLSDGRTAVERLVEQRRPRLTDDERELVLGWRDVVEGCFDVRGLDGDAVELHNGASRSPSYARGCSSSGVSCRLVPQPMPGWSAAISPYSRSPRGARSPRRPRLSSRNAPNCCAVTRTCISLIDDRLAELLRAGI